MKTGDGCKIDLENVPTKVNSADDLLWLLEKTEKGYGRKTARLSVEELTFLYETAKSLSGSPHLLEIGRMYGGSTIALGVGMPKAAFLLSIDIADINAAENILRLGLQSLDASHKSC